jgi:SAM-dependent methyltransferase
MIDVARSSHPGSAVEWVRLDPDWEVLPFADASFDGIVASSVFEYLDDVPRVAAELSKVLRPEGVLLLTVPNPCNWVRKLEAGLQWMPLVQQLSSALRRVQRIDSYAAYLCAGMAVRSERRALRRLGRKGFHSRSLAASGSRAAGPLGREKGDNGW